MSPLIDYKTTGPIPLAAYMRQCLTSLDGGYYTHQRAEERDQFGTRGDFITSPEISQVFGELVGIWVVAEWSAQGKKLPLQLIELGPGRGTLMNDMLRTIRQFGPSIDGIHLVEASPFLREKQWKLLCDESPLTETASGWESQSKHFPGQKITWSEDLKKVPKSGQAAPFIIAHEFFDALPIHAFQAVESKSRRLTISATAGASPKKQNEWQELLVAPTSQPPPSSTKYGPAANDADQDFTLVVSQAPTPFSQYLPTTSSRYQKILPIAGATIEISPESLTIAAEIATRIGGEPSSSSATASSPSGAALIVDYGPSDTVPANSLRGIRDHQRVSPFSAPGSVDLSADVDFTALAEAALNASPGVEVHSPVEQAAFLAAMGIKERSEIVMQEAQKNGDENGAKQVESGWQRLVDRNPQGMGRLYKMMAIVPFQKGVVRRPVGFGGDVKDA